ncbi:MAG: hypothetical protein ACLFMU_04045 [Bacteroidales bacterium]
MIRTALFIVLHAFLSGGLVSAGGGLQEADPDSLFFREAEDSLRALATRIVRPEGDEERLQNNQEFKTHLNEVLAHEGSFNYPLDSLGPVSVLYAPDKHFRLFTWYVPLSGQEFRYFGYLQRGPEEALNDALYELTDNTGQIGEEEAGVLDPGNWYGAYYYEVIHHQDEEGKDLYTLLGWKGNNSRTRIRVIEPLVIRQGDPVFGHRVFDGPYAGNHRVIFQYSAAVSMSLQYEQDFFQKGDSLYHMIVFDRLEPQNERLRGHYQFYKPEVNIFDGMYFEDGRWVLVEDVDARMPAPEEK